VRGASVKLATLLMCSLLVAGCASPRGAVGQSELAVEKLALLPAAVSETSGLAWHQGALWTHNDSGDGALIYRLAPDTGAVEQTVRLQDAVNFDWEEMAASTGELFVFDCGNNLGRRGWMQVYAVDRSRLASSAVEVPSRLLEFRFADAGPSEGAYAHDNDCEAATLVNGRLWIFSKNWNNQQTRLYRLNPQDASRQSLRSEGSFPVSGLITSADYDVTTGMLVLLGYTKGRFSSEAFIWLVPVQRDTPVWSSARRHSLAPAGQWEAVAWRNGELWLTRESSLLGQAWLGRVILP